MKNDSNATWQEWKSASNISERERTASFAAGALLALFGFSCRSKIGGLLAMFGAFLLHRGATQQCAVYRLLGLNSAANDEDIFEILPAADANVNAA